MQVYVQDLMTLTHEQTTVRHKFHEKIDDVLLWNFVT